MRSQSQGRGGGGGGYQQGGRGGYQGQRPQGQQQMVIGVHGSVHSS